MFLILRNIDWKEEDYLKGDVVPVGWCEDNNRLIPKNVIEKPLYKYLTL